MDFFAAGFPKRGTGGAAMLVFFFPGGAGIAKPLGPFFGAGFARGSANPLLLLLLSALELGFGRSGVLNGSFLSFGPFCIHAGNVNPRPRPRPTFTEPR